MVRRRLHELASGTWGRCFHSHGGGGGRGQTGRGLSPPLLGAPKSSEHTSFLLTAHWLEQVTWPHLCKRELDNVCEHSGIWRAVDVYATVYPCGSPKYLSSLLNTHRMYSAHLQRFIYSLHPGPSLGLQVLSDPEVILLS